MNLKELLSQEQYAAATHIDGPVCILAGAGSGKTRVITHRVAYLMGHKRVRPWSILAVTFTNKAAAEMRHRVEHLMPGTGRKVKVGTFHGMAARFLRQFGDSVGVPRSFVIYDQDDAMRLMKRVVVDEMSLSKEMVRPILSRVGSWQCEGLTPVEVPSTPWSEADEKARLAYFQYYERLAGMGAVDFGGLLVKWRDLLRLPAGAEVRDRVQHLLVDEYQDVNRVQAEIVAHLADTAETVAVVGDDDQAIYGWRGASSDNLKHFVEQTEGAHLVRLEENYRSTEHILSAANGIIRFNAQRLGKVLRPAAHGEGEQHAHPNVGRRVRVMRARDDIDEARRVVRMMQESLSLGKSPEDIAVLYRTNAASRTFEDELRRASIGYRLVGGVRFYDRKEVKDVLATLRAALNPRSDVDTVRMVAAVPRGIGEKSMAKIQALAGKEGLSVLETMAERALLEGAGVAKRARKNAAELAERVLELGDKIRPKTDEEGRASPAILDAKEAVAQATELSGVADRLEAEGTPESEGRLENLGALLNAAAQHVEDMAATGGSPDVLGFLEAASLLGGDDQDPAQEADGEKITLMTLHSAKGLEYDLVFLSGLEEGGFPHAMATRDGGDDEAIEEERRLAYVGITRAKSQLVISWARRRMVQGTPKPRQMSRFLEELPMQVLEGDLPRPTGRSRGRFPELVRAGGPRTVARDDGAVVEYDPEAAGDDGYDQGGVGGVLMRASPSEAEALARSFRAVKDRLRLVEPPSPPADEHPDEPRVELDPEVQAGALDEHAAEHPAHQEPDHLQIEPLPEDGPPAEAPEPGGLVDGGLVEHNVFGRGRIVGFRGQGRLRSALVMFERERRPRVIIVRHLKALATEGR